MNIEIYKKTMGQNASNANGGREIIEKVIPKHKNQLGLEKNRVLVSLQTQICLQTAARSFLLRRRNIEKLEQYKYQISLPPPPDFPYEEFSESLERITHPVVISIEKLLPAVKIQKSEFEFKPAVIYKEKIVYEGEWEMAEFIRKGYGIEIMPDGSKYIGEFDNFKQGIGRKI